MSKDSIITKEMKMLVENEIAALQKLNHPYIVKVYDIIQTTNSYYIVMEYLAGGNLNELINIGFVYK
jgi:serine/threonine protein kinase